MPTIVIGGDVCPVGRNDSLFKEGNASSIFSDLLDVFRSSDFSIVNLECPLIESKSPIKKNGPTLGVESACVNGLKNAGINAVTLANNHIMDHGIKGLRNTIEVCRNAGIQTVGAGMNVKEAGKPLYHSIENKKIGIIGVAENEFSIAEEDSAGANPLNLYQTSQVIKENRSDLDLLIILYHGGKELYEYPSPLLADTCRFLIETGADVVIVQHTHCPGTIEEYQNGYIVYGQGNLIFDKYKSQPAFRKGFLVMLTSLSSGKKLDLQIIPYVQSDKFPGAKRMAAKDEAEFLQMMQKRSKQISEKGFIEESWNKLCENKKQAYLNRILGPNRIIKKLNSYYWFRKLFYGDDFMLRLRNTITCESHHEVLLTLFKKNML